MNLSRSLWQPLSIIGSMLGAAAFFIASVLLIFALALSVDALLACVLCWAIGVLWHPVSFLPVFAIVFVVMAIFGGTKT